MMLNSFIDKIVNYCLCADIVSTDNVPWLRYGIEQRISTLFILIPFSYFHWFLQISGEQVLFWWLFIY